MEPTKLQIIDIAIEELTRRIKHNHTTTSHELPLFLCHRIEFVVLQTGVDHTPKVQARVDELLSELLLFVTDKETQSVPPWWGTGAFSHATERLDCITRFREHVARGKR